MITITTLRIHQACCLWSRSRLVVAVASGSDTLPVSTSRIPSCPTTTSISRSPAPRTSGVDTRKVPSAWRLRGWFLPSIATVTSLLLIRPWSFARLIRSASPASVPIASRVSRADRAMLIRVALPAASTASAAEPHTRMQAVTPRATRRCARAAPQTRENPLMASQLCASDLRARCESLNPAARVSQPADLLTGNGSGNRTHCRLRKTPRTPGNSRLALRRSADGQPERALSRRRPQSHRGCCESLRFSGRL
jgi:hypothetical protein